MHNSKGGSPKILNYDCTNYFLYHQNAFEISPFFCSFWWKFWLFDPNPWIRLFFGSGSKNPKSYGSGSKAVSNEIVSISIC